MLVNAKTLVVVLYYTYEFNIWMTIMYLTYSDYAQIDVCII